MKWLRLAPLLLVASLFTGAAACDEMRDNNPAYNYPIWKWRAVPGVPSQTFTTVAGSTVHLPNLPDIFFEPDEGGRLVRFWLSYERDSGRLTDWSDPAKHRLSTRVTVHFRRSFDQIASTSDLGYNVVIKDTTALPNSSNRQHQYICRDLRTESYKGAGLDCRVAATGRFGGSVEADVFVDVPEQGLNKAEAVRYLDDRMEEVLLFEQTLSGASSNSKSTGAL